MAHATHRCDRCTRNYSAVRANQRFCRPCRLLTSLEYWSEGRTKPDLCRCGVSWKRVDRSNRVCPECAPTPWRGDCICCGSKALEIYRPEVPICIWCLYDATPGVRSSVTEALRRWIGAETARPRRQTAPPQHPGLAALRVDLEMAAQRLGCTVDEALVRAKETLGLARTQKTNDYAAVIAALEAL